MNKKQLRQDMRAKLAAQPAPDRAEKSRRAQERLFDLPVFRRARTVALFASMDGEIDTHSIIDRALAEGKQVGLPRVDGARKELVFHAVQNRKKDTKPGVLGILEPDPTLPVIAPGAFEFVAVPGLAFDEAGRRLGRGAGYYDRFLARLSPGTAKIGIGFSFQKIREVPVEPHDEKLDGLLTD